MFGKKSNVTKQINLKEELVEKIQLAVYGLEKKGINKSLDVIAVNDLMNEVKKTVHKLENSIGDGICDISIGCKKVENDLQELKRAAGENLLGNFEDSVSALIVDMEEIIDLEDGKISEISLEIDETSRSKQKLRKKLNDVKDIETTFMANRNRVEADIQKKERNKAELDEKLLKETNTRIKQNLFLQIKTTINNINTLKLKSGQYENCIGMIDSIKTYANELVESGDLSKEAYDRASMILNTSRLKQVLDDPHKLKPLLYAIEQDIKKAKENAKTINKQLEDAFNFGEESYDEMNKYQDSLLDKKAETIDIQEDASSLEEYMKNLK